MKRFSAILSLCILLMSSCVVYTPYITYHYFNYHRYIKDGMIVSPSFEYSGYKYIPLHRITVEIGINGRDKNPSEELMVNELVERAKNKGANGVIGVDIKFQPASKSQPQPRFLASGLAVKFDDSIFDSVE